MRLQLKNKKACVKVLFMTLTYSILLALYIIFYMKYQLQAFLSGKSTVTTFHEYPNSLPHQFLKSMTSKMNGIFLGCQTITIQT